MLRQKKRKINSDLVTTSMQMIEKEDSQWATTSQQQTENGGYLCVIWQLVILKADGEVSNQCLVQ
jgi:hypothetical protein